MSHSADPSRVPKRVLFINDTARNGGPGRSLYCILKFLDPHVVHRAVLLPRAGAVSELLARGAVFDELFFESSFVENPIEPWSRPMERADFDAHPALRALRLVGNIAKTAAALRRMRGLILGGGGKLGFDLIYCNGTNADFAGAALASLTGVPALWHVRYTSLPKAVRGLHRRLAAGSSVARIVCVSGAAASLFEHCPEKVRVIHNALDLDEFSTPEIEPKLRQEFNLPAGSLIFGSVGRILPRKGYLEMIRAAELALAELNEAEKARVRFVIVGDTPADIRPDHLAECRSYVQEKRLDNYILLPGFREDVRPYIVDFDVAVVPSVYADPLPRAVIESMALAKPVIAFDVGGVGEMIQSGVTGQLIAAAPPDVPALARSFVAYARNSALCREQGQAARAHIERHFDGRDHGLRIQDQILEAILLSKKGLT